MTPLRALVCDDEPLALDRLGDLLAQCDGIELIGSALSGVELLANVAEFAPDIVFLDVEMPRLDGFDVVDALSRLPWRDGAGPPLVVFVTAHPEMAAGAFDSGALDFISKPVRLDRLERAVERARQARALREAGRRMAELAAQLDQLKALRDGDERDRHVWLQRRSESIRVAVDAIDWIGAEGEYVRYHAGDESFLERGSLTAVAAAMAPHGFVRVHRSWIVNRASVVGLERTRWGDLSVRLRSGTMLRVGKLFRAAARGIRD